MFREQLHLSLQENPRGSFHGNRQKKGPPKWWCCFRNCFWHHCSKSSNAKFGTAQQMLPETAPWLRRPCKRQAQAGNFKQHGLLARGSYIMSKFLTATNQNIKTCQSFLSLQLSKHLWRGYHVLIQLDFLPIAIWKIFLGSEKNPFLRGWS